MALGSLFAQLEARGLLQAMCCCNDYDSGKIVTTVTVGKEKTKFESDDRNEGATTAWHSDDMRSRDAECPWQVMRS